MPRANYNHYITDDSALGGMEIKRSWRVEQGTADVNSGSNFYRTFGSGNRRTFTTSVWVKKCDTPGNIGDDQYAIFTAGGGGSGSSSLHLYFYNDDRLQYSGGISGSASFDLRTDRRFRDTCNWYHIVAAVDSTAITSSDRVKLYVNGVQQTNLQTASYPSQNAEFYFNYGIRHRIGSFSRWANMAQTYGNFNGYMADFHFIDGAQLTPASFGYTDTMTGMWRPKRFKFATDIPNKTTRTYSGTFTASGNGFGSQPTTNAFNGDISNGFNNSAGGQIITWNTSTYNLSGNIRIYGRGSAYDVYVNGNTTKVADMPSSNGWVDLGTHEKINEIQWAGTTYNTNNGLGSAGVHVNMIIVDGVVLRDDFHEFGQNGYHLEFKDDSGTTATTMGKDTSGNGNNWTPVNFSVASDFMTDIVTDSPSNNFCVLNYNGGSGNKPTDGGLSGVNAGTSGWRHTYGTFPLTRGKWYWEYRFSGSVDGSNGIFMGLAHADLTYERDINSNSADMYGRQNRGRYANGTNTDPHFAAVSSGDTVQFAFDADTGVMWSGLNNTWTGAEPSTGNSPSYTGIDASKGYVPVTGSYGSNNYNKVNFGQQGFKYTPPSGFRAICSEFMETPEVTVLNPKKHFRDLYYTGNGGTQSITGLEFQPDFAWIKSRSSNHHSSLTDSVRGMLKTLSTSRSDIGEYSESAGLNSFLPNGLGFNGNNYFSVNVNSDNFVAWCFKGGGSSNTYNIDGVGYASAAAAGLNGGTITPTGTSINTESGLSIIAYTGNGTNGASMSHGLPRAPKLMIHRSRGNGRNWYTITTAIDGTPDYFYLNLTNSANNSAVTAPTSDLMYFTSSQESNNNGENYIVYAFCEIPGYCKIGTYKGFGNENGPVVYCGFRPKFVLVKCTTHGEHWNIPVDSNNFNGVDKTVSPNLSNGERDMSGSGLYGDAMDYLADGFKIKNIDNNYNRGGATFFYMAIADTPNLPHFNQYPPAR